MTKYLALIQTSDDIRELSFQAYSLQAAYDAASRLGQVIDIFEA